MSIRNAKVVAQLDESFLRLCEQYAVQGRQLQALAHQFATLGIGGKGEDSIGAQLLKQYYEIGEQLKTVGVCVDMLGGKKALRDEDRARIFTGSRNELKRQGIKIRKAERQ